ncbi:hypothetical protein [Bradyrhizobium uaiense]|uniref:Uncharacterized protein n=1 Tax=Bradyrhizobium uaiense TaxID=2594946 RepID=A0A6P1B9H8_9BRAD|nr:hypothetical protein [Bradyrhizobium uaiense]NEU95019.1 hypothetical protein [Bradyrhizobium uaiense]
MATLDVAISIPSIRSDSFGFGRLHSLPSGGSHSKPRSFAAMTEVTVERVALGGDSRGLAVIEQSA